MSSIERAVVACVGLVQVSVIISILKNIYNNRPVPPLRLPGHVKVFVVDDPIVCETVLKAMLENLKKSDFPCWGLDVEWTPFRKPIRSTLLQISDAEIVLLVRLQRIGSMPQLLKDVLANPAIAKCGVGVLEDARKLAVDHGLEVKSCVELQTPATQWKYTTKGLGLSAISYTVLGAPLEKKQSIRGGNWDAEILSDAQIRYAALDAYSGHQILYEIWQRHYPAEKTFEDCFGSLFDQKAVAVRTQKPVNRTPKPPRSLNAIPERRDPLYENCQMLSPEGELLATINRKKVDWYLQRDLGVLISEDPPTVKLNFTPGSQD